MCFTFVTFVFHFGFILCYTLVSGVFHLGFLKFDFCFFCLTLVSSAITFTLVSYMFYKHKSKSNEIVFISIDYSETRFVSFKVQS